MNGATNGKQRGIFVGREEQSKKGACRYLSTVLSSRHGVWNVFNHAFSIMADHDF